MVLQPSSVLGSSSPDLLDIWHAVVWNFDLLTPLRRPVQVVYDEALNAIDRWTSVTINDIRVTNLNMSYCYYGFLLVPNAVLSTLSTFKDYQVTIPIGYQVASEDFSAVT